MKLVFAIILCFSMQSLMSQELKDLQWKHRVLVTNSPKLVQEQLKMLEQDSLGAKERKLVLLELSGEQFTARFPNDFSQKFNAEKSLFQKKNEVLLIGLDGGVKHRKEKAFTIKELFSLIDSMPMRAAEMRKKDNE